MPHANRPLQLGLSLPTLGRWATKENIIRAATFGEDAGFRSVWAAQRLLFPARPVDGHAFIGKNGQWPSIFKRVMDPLSVLALVGANTTRIRLGTAVINAPYYSPVLLANELATLDILTDGRLEVGLGLGWSRDEFAAVGVAYEDRGRRFEEFVQCLRELWSADVVEFDGEFYHIPRSSVEPKPMQRPHPPILVGGSVSASLRRARTMGDGYIAGAVPYGVLRRLLTELRNAEETEGVPRTRVVARGTIQLTESRQGRERVPLCGDVTEIKDDVLRYWSLGVDELVVDLNADAVDHEDALDARSLMDRLEVVVEACAEARGGTA